MAVSLLNVLVADKVNALLDDPHVRDNLSDDQRGFTRDQAEAVIHAAVWAYSARAGSTAEAYARMSLFDALGLKSWSFKEPEQHTPETPVTLSPSEERSFAKVFEQSPRRVQETGVQLTVRDGQVEVTTATVTHCDHGVSLLNPCDQCRQG
jgi:hypothetical protein